eukprot:4089605-Amphidinium_carterae.1
MWLLTVHRARAKVGALAPLWHASPTSTRIYTRNYIFTCSQLLSGFCPRLRPLRRLTTRRRLKMDQITPARGEMRYNFIRVQFAHCMRQRWMPLLSCERKCIQSGSTWIDATHAPGLATWSFTNWFADLAHTCTNHGGESG